MVDNNYYQTMFDSLDIDEEIIFNYAKQYWSLHKNTYDFNDFDNIDEFYKFVKYDTLDFIINQLEEDYNLYNYVEVYSYDEFGSNLKNFYEDLKYFIEKLLDDMFDYNDFQEFFDDIT